MKLLVRERVNIRRLFGCAQHGPGLAQEVLIGLALSLEPRVAIWSIGLLHGGLDEVAQLRVAVRFLAHVSRAEASGARCRWVEWHQPRSL